MKQPTYRPTNSSIEVVRFLVIFSKIEHAEMHLVSHIFLDKRIDASRRKSISLASFSSSGHRRLLTFPALSDLAGFI